MIDSRILTTLKSRNENPAYCVLITGYQTTEDCNQEKLIIKLHQINKSLNQIENLSGVNILEKELIIQSDMDYDDINQAFKSTLTGFTNFKGNLSKPNAVINDYANHHIEVIETELKSEIEIHFNRPYTTMPSIIPTIDVKYQSYYKTYDIEFIEEDSKYTGVKIFFNKLKRKNNYPLINIAIIGDMIV